MSYQKQVSDRINVLLKSQHRDRLQTIELETLLSPPLPPVEWLHDIPHFCNHEPNVDTELVGRHTFALKADNPLLENVVLHGIDLEYIEERLGSDIVTSEAEFLAAVTLDAAAEAVASAKRKEQQKAQPIPF